MDANVAHGLVHRFIRLSPANRRIFLQKLAEQDIDFALLPIPPGLTKDTQPPLSYAQQRLWFLTKLTPEGGAYNIAGALRLRGEVDVVALGRSVEALVARH